MTEENLTQQSKESTDVMIATITGSIGKAHDEFDSGKIASANHTLSKVWTEIDNIPLKQAILLARQYAAYHYTVGNLEKCHQTLKKLSYLQRKNGQYDRAINSLATSLALRPDDHDIEFQIAATVVESGDIPLGVSRLRNIVKDNPDHDAAVSLLLKSSVKYRPESVVALIHKHLERNPENVESHRNAVAIYEELGMKKEAVLTRMNVVNLISSDELALSSFVEECCDKYPTESFFLEKKFELAAVSKHWDRADSAAKQLVDIATLLGNTKLALKYTEIRLIIDTASDSLMKKSESLRKTLKLVDSPFTNNKPPTQTLEASRNLLSNLNFSAYMSTITTEMSENVDNMELLSRLRFELLDMNKKWHALLSHFEGNSSTSESVWADIKTANTTQEFADLFADNPDSLPILQKWLSVQDSEKSKALILIDVARRAVEKGDKQNATNILQILSSIHKSLVEFYPELIVVLTKLQEG
ncbi:MAG TPA: hypothetical protein PKV16_06955 [Caldisericia bacterium]|nr:hypothetical protein [Caldisericia bacterium]HPF49506.1 hypothetical protein [Caldisericia bacterium]HPI84200.1 hypothetical protein [Caldisericia bacterium]HPQ93505.1 hypothetical protein [Caldisericia bacterium]HRV75489.1 hypothetical protein [Caldisericia bacterium]